MWKTSSVPHRQDGCHVPPYAHITSHGCGVMSCLVLPCRLWWCNFRCEQAMWSEIISGAHTHTFEKGQSPLGPSFRESTPQGKLASDLDGALLEKTIRHFLHPTTSGSPSFIHQGRYGAIRLLHFIIPSWLWAQIDFHYNTLWSSFQPFCICLPYSYMIICEDL